MTDNPTSPLLGDEAERRQNSWKDSRTLTQRSRSSTASKRSRRSAQSDESTPLLARADDGTRSPAQQSLDDLADAEITPSKSRAQWPTLVALVLVGALVFTILGLGFAAPGIVEQYTKEAVVFEPTDLSIVSITSTGVNARIRGNFVADGSRVTSKPARDLGRAGTWIVKAVESKPTTVRVYLPEYDNLLLGSADVPGIVVSVRDGEITPIDFTTQVHPGDFDGIRRIAMDWVDGHLTSLQVSGKADVGLKSGIFGLPTQSISREMVFQGKNIPTMPVYKITKFNVHEIPIQSNRAGMAADVNVVAHNDYPLNFQIPTMAFDILVPGCPTVGDMVLLANATTSEIEVLPKQDVTVRAQGIVRRLPETLVTVCPGMDASPLDILLKDYISGSKSTIYVRGSSDSSGDTPQWLQDLVKGITVPVSFPGHAFNGLIRNFTMDKVHFSLPDPLAEPGTPGASPQVSAIVKVIANLPKEMNFPVDVDQIRATGEVFYKAKKLGHLDLHEWQKANSTRIYPHGDIPSGIAVDAKIKNAPIKITDNNVFTEVVQAMLFSRNSVILGIKAIVDINTHTALGNLIARGIPAAGEVPVKPHGGKGIDFNAIKPRITSLEIQDTTKNTVLLEAKINLTNPTSYSAAVPYININILANNTILGHATARNLSLGPGVNHLVVHALWDPVSHGGPKGPKIARDFISQYISGKNTTLTLATSNETFPTLPQLGLALSNLSVTIPTPRLGPPKTPSNSTDPDAPDAPDDGPRFISNTTFHILSSTATFVLHSPLQHNTIYLTRINATAYYNHTEPIGVIVYDEPFAVPPWESETPRLPVDWDIGSVGYQAIRDALGGRLKLDANAEVDLKLGLWTETVMFEGKRIGAGVSL